MQITLFTLPDCGICHMIKTKMEQKNISFKEEDFNTIAESMGLDRAPLLQIQKDNNEGIEYFMSPQKMLEWINKQ